RRAGPAPVEVRDDGARDVSADLEAGSVVAEQPPHAVGDRHDLTGLDADRRGSGAGDEGVAGELDRARAVGGEEVGADVHSRPISRMVKFFREPPVARELRTAGRADCDGIETFVDAGPTRGGTGHRVEYRLERDLSAR